jgi:hypothetical protein
MFPLPGAGQTVLRLFPRIIISASILSDMNYVHAHVCQLLKIMGYWVAAGVVAFSFMAQHAVEGRCG